MSFAICFVIIIIVITSMLWLPEYLMERQENKHKEKMKEIEKKTNCS
jgi:preprotein translocase subunit YajC